MTSFIFALHLRWVAKEKLVQPVVWQRQQLHWLLGHSLLMGDLGVGHTNDAGGRREHSMRAGEE